MAKKTSKEKKKKKESLKKKREARAAKQASAPQPSKPSQEDKKMKIAMMSAWNETSGVSIHAELVGEEWVKAGHELKVFSFLEDDFHGYSLIGVDQPYVTRCFGTPGRSNYLNPIPFLKENYDLFVVQDLGMLPKDKLAKIFPSIHKKAKAILVVHAGRLPDDPSFFQFDWDAIVCFDHRYKGFLKEVFPEDKIYTIPFPCHRWMEGDKVEARRKYRENTVAPIREALGTLHERLRLRFHVDYISKLEEGVWADDEIKKQVESLRDQMPSLEGMSTGQVLVDFIPLAAAITDKDLRTQIERTLTYFVMKKESREKLGITDEDLEGMFELSYQKLEDYVALAD